MKKFILMLVFSMLSLFSMQSNADDELITDFQSWNQVVGTYHFNDKWIGYLEGNARLYNDGGDLGVFMARTAVGYQIDPHWSVWLGYAYNGTYNAHKGGSWFKDEHRVYQQLSFTDKWADWITYTNRLRLEERNYEYADTNVRIRDMVRLEAPIAKDFYVSAQDEIFFNLSGNQTTKPGFDQNRAWVGVGYYFTPQIKAETGYMNQYQNVYGEDKMNHIISTSVYFNF